MTELPTLEGRVMADLGHQVAELRAKLQQAEADNARLRAALEGVSRWMGDTGDAQMDEYLRRTLAETR